MRPDPQSVLSDLWLGLGGEPAALERVRMTGAEPVVRSPFAVGTAAASAAAAAGLASAELWRERGGSPGEVSVDMRHAAASFRSERHARVGGHPIELWDPLSRVYRTADGWIRLHGNYPHHREAILTALGTREGAPERVAERVAARGAGELATAIEGLGGAAGVFRSRSAWSSLDQAQALSRLPLVDTAGLSDGAPRPLDPGDSPLAGVRVLDLTRVIAGPVCGRVLASQGADVLHVAAAHLPSQPQLELDTNVGKRSCHLDLRRAAEAEALRRLAAAADLLVQSYRPGALERLGFGPSALSSLNPGLVYISIGAYGHAGPWSARRGFDSLVQMETGLADEQARAEGGPPPRPLPAQALDHATGWLAAAGGIAALRRRAREGGGWHVCLSLARTAIWLDALGRIDDGLDAREPDRDEVSRWLLGASSYAGRVQYVSSPAVIEGVPEGGAQSPPRPGGDGARWPAARAPNAR